VCCVLTGVEGRIDQKFDLELRSAAGGAVQPRPNVLTPWWSRAWFDHQGFTSDTYTARSYALQLALWTLAAPAGSWSYESCMLRRGWGQAGEGEVAIDPEYRRLSRERHQAAATKTRLMRVIDDPRAGTIARAAPPVKIQIGKRKARCRSGRHALPLCRVTCKFSLLAAPTRVCCGYQYVKLTV